VASNVRPLAFQLLPSSGGHITTAAPRILRVVALKDERHGPEEVDPKEAKNTVNGTVGASGVGDTSALKRRGNEMDGASANLETFVLCGVGTDPRPWIAGRRWVGAT
jgi:hypothetical protein